MDGSVTDVAGPSSFYPQEDIMDVLWVKIESWHALGPVERLSGYETLCGITAPSDSETSYTHTCKAFR